MDVESNLCKLISVDKFNHEDLVLNLTDECLSVMTINVRSFRGNFATVVLFISSLKVKPQILILTETWLNDEDCKLYNIPGYNVHNVTRNNYGGGIACYYINHLYVTQIKEFTGIFDACESLCIELRSGSFGTLTILCVYRPPSLKAGLFLEYMSSFLERFGKCIVVGDLNLNLLDYNNVTVIDFCLMMNSFGLSNELNVATYVDPRKGYATTLLDHVWHNFKKTGRTFVFEVPIADHLPVLAVYNYSVGKDLNLQSFRNFSIRCKEAFLTNITEEMGKFNIDNDDPGKSVSCFINHLWLLLNKYFPIKKKFLSQKRILKPWLSSKLIKCIDKKHKLFGLLKRKQIPYKYFKAYSSLLKYTLKLVERNFYRKKFKKSGTSGEVWRTYRGMIGDFTTKNNYVIKHNGSTVVDERDLTKLFNEYFSFVPSQMVSSIEKSLNNYNEQIPISMTSMYFNPTTADEVRAVIGKLKASNGLNDLPTKFIKLLTDHVSVVIAKLFNLCIENGIYPDELKCARVVPVYKNGNDSLLQNYRPISILNVLAKIFEKLIYTRLNNYFNTNGLFSSNQFGFTKHKDTSQAVILSNINALNAYINKSYVIGVFLDFSKAFDTVDHDLLLHKLHRYGLRGVVYDFMRSYLANRTQYVQIKDCKSSPIVVTTGVPQGSCLGPLLFNIYTNDLNFLLTDVKAIMYADDVVFYAESGSLDLLTSFVEQKLHSVYDWCKFNRLVLNTSKTKLIMFTPFTVNMSNICINGDEIEFVNSFKYLGVVIDKDLKYHDQVNLVCNKTLRLVAITHRIRKYLDLKTARTMYYALVYSSLFYSIESWGGYMVSSLRRDRIQIIQNKLVKNLFGIFFPLCSTLELYKRLNILRAREIYKMRVTVIIYKTLNYGYFPEIRPFLCNNDATYSVRNFNDLRVPYPRVDAVKLNFLYTGLSVWNSLPLTIREAPNVVKFKNDLRIYFLGQY